MREICPSRLRGSPVVIVGVSVLLGLVGGGAVVELFGRVIGSLLAATGSFLLLAGILTAVYPRVGYDAERGLVRTGRREVPVATVRRATRWFATGGSTHLVHRLISDGGPSARIIVAGSPMRGLEPVGATALRELLGSCPLTSRPGRPLRTVGSPATCHAAGEPNLPDARSRRRPEGAVRSVASGYRQRSGPAARCRLGCCRGRPLLAHGGRRLER